MNRFFLSMGLFAAIGLIGCGGGSGNYSGNSNLFGQVELLISAAVLSEPVNASYEFRVKTWIDSVRQPDKYYPVIDLPVNEYNQYRITTGYLFAGSSLRIKIYLDYNRGSIKLGELFY